MGQPRIQLQDKLEEILRSKSVYFQPPATVKLKYPCIIYKLDAKDELRANNARYLSTNRYQVTVVDRNPDSAIPDRISELQYCSFERFYTSDNLNHFIYNLYF